MKPGFTYSIVYITCEKHINPPRYAHNLQTQIN